MRKPTRAPAKTAPRSRKTKPSKSAAPRRLTLAAAPPEERREAAQLEQISIRYAESERAWLRMTAPPDGDEPWSAVEEHLVARTRPDDPERRWKYFSK